MTRTKRRKPKSSEKVPDGTPLHVSNGCKHHGTCEWCKSNRTHANRKREGAGA